MEVLATNLKARFKLVTEGFKAKANLNPNMAMVVLKDSLKVRDSGTKEVSKDSLSLR